LRLNVFNLKGNATDPSYKLVISVCQSKASKTLVFFLDQDNLHSWSRTS